MFSLPNIAFLVINQHRAEASSNRRLANESLPICSLVIPYASFDVIQHDML